MGGGKPEPRLRAASAVRWALVGSLSVAQGASGWYFTVFGVYGLEDFDGALLVSIVALPVSLLLVVLDFRTAARRSVLWTWLVLRAIAVPLLGLGIGSLVRVRFAAAGSAPAHGSFDSHAIDYAWQLAALGATLLAIQPLVSGIRRIITAVFGVPRASAWPGSTPTKAVAGVVAFALIAGLMLVFAGRVFWHVAVHTTGSVPPMVATGTIDGRELAVIGYDERVFGLQRNARVAAYDLETGELVWDQRLPNARGNPATVDAILLEERSAFMRMDHPSHAAVWFALDPRTGEIEHTAEEGDLRAVEDAGEAAPGIPRDAVERYVERDRLVPDDGYEHEFTEDADLEPVFRYEDESLLIYPTTGRPAGEDHGFTLHRICCDRTALEARAEGGSVLWALDGAAPSSREVVAETEDGRVVMLIDGPESKWRLVIAHDEGFAEAVIGDRGWLPW